jgi:hypothetical protein
LKKLLGGPSKNFWYGVEEDKYLGASALGSDMVTMKKFLGLNDKSIDVSSSHRYVG